MRVSRFNVFTSRLDEYARDVVLHNDKAHINPRSDHILRSSPFVTSQTGAKRRLVQRAHLALQHARAAAADQLQHRVVAAEAEELALAR